MTAVASTLHPGSTERRRFVTFVVTGGIAAAVNVSSRFLLSLVVSYEVAIAGAYLLGMTTAFLLARYYVFDGGRRRWSSEFGRFAAVNVLAFLQVLGVSELLARLLFPAVGWRWHAADLAHLIGVVSPVVVSYHAHKHFSFGGSRAA